MPKRAVLLVNLGSPDSTSIPDVRKYLDEFLGDERVIDRPPQPFRSMIFNGIVIPRRAPKSAHAYEQIWTPEGSPLITISKSVHEKLAAALGPQVPVYLAMRYGNPSIAAVVAQIAADGIEEVLLFPQYPHYAMCAKRRSAAPRNCGCPACSRSTPMRTTSRRCMR
jgi:ferrochelatase